MGMPALKETYTYKDYRQWKGPDRFELIQGEPVMMAPSPGADHQDSSLSIASELRTILRKNHC